MKTHRIATIGHDSYILPEKFSIEDSFRFLDFLAGCRKIDCGEYIADKTSRYARSVMVLRDEQIDVAVKVTAAPVMTREEYQVAREAGDKEYNEANPATPPIRAA